jgi:hypothetical protein
LVCVLRKARTVHSGGADGPRLRVFVLCSSCSLSTGRRRLVFVGGGLKTVRVEGTNDPSGSGSLTGRDGRSVFRVNLLVVLVAFTDGPSEAHGRSASVPRTVRDLITDGSSWPDRLPKSFAS